MGGCSPATLRVPVPLLGVLVWCSFWVRVLAADTGSSVPLSSTGLGVLTGSTLLLSGCSQQPWEVGIVPISQTRRHVPRKEK